MHGCFFDGFFLKFLPDFKVLWRGLASRLLIPVLLKSLQLFHISKLKVASCLTMWTCLQEENCRSTLAFSSKMPVPSGRLLKQRPMTNCTMATSRVALTKINPCRSKLFRSSRLKGDDQSPHQGIRSRDRKVPISISSMPGLVPVARSCKTWNFFLPGKIHSLIRSSSIQSRFFKTFLLHTIACSRSSLLRSSHHLHVHQLRIP